MTNAASRCRPKSADRLTVQETHRSMMAYMGRHGLSGDAFSRRCGVSYSTLAKMGYADASWSTVERVRAFLAQERAAS